MTRTAAVLAACAWVALDAAPLPMEISRDAYVMGTSVRLVAWDSTRAGGLAALDRLLSEIESADRELSTWRSGSEVTRLNGSSGSFHLSRALCETLAEVSRWTRATGGAFDPALGALTSAWGIHTGGRIPSPEELERARRSSGWARLGFDPVACTAVRDAGAALDVGGFGKGAALDRARQRAPGSEDPWLVDLGGQIAVSLAPPGRQGWRIAIAHPLRRDAPALEIELTGGSLATSAGSERDLHVGGRRIAHILDPRTGRPATFTGSVSVWHESALAADALSTALFVMGPSDGVRWANRENVAVCFLIPGARGALRIDTSSAFRRRFPRCGALPRGVCFE